MSEEISEMQSLEEATGRFCTKGTGCPKCGAIGKLSSHDTYTRHLTSHRGGNNIYSRASPVRFICKSCKSTHALLPGILVPHSPYSLPFKLAVLIAYFERETSVANICERFGIAVSTLYRWKDIMVSHKELLLGVLISRKTHALAFLRGLLLSGALSDTLSSFFNKFGFSFLQGSRALATRSQPP